MGFYIFIAVIILLVCLLLALIVLIQNPKGGGLSSTFGGQGNQFLGVRKTTDFLEKGTWVLAGALLVLSLISAYSIPRGNSTEEGPSTELSVDENALRLPALPTQPQPQQVPTE
ncbi:MAG: preprotein translocase subunit SecG [Bacteroidales bacterium]|jgi:preprotein translocase subunit SecG|nr:preprotein translocase subunit SecG [Bacteroidales bacterium]